MTTTTTTTPRSSVTLKIGLVIAGILGLGDLFNAFTQFVDNPADPFVYASAVFGIATLVLIPFAWRGSSGAGWAVAIIRVVSSLLGLPAFFVPEVPAPFVIAAAVGIVLAVLAAVLIVGRKRTV